MVRFEKALMLAKVGRHAAAHGLRAAVHSGEPVSGAAACQGCLGAPVQAPLAVPVRCLPCARLRVWCRVHPAWHASTYAPPHWALAPPPRRSLVTV